MLTGTLVIGVLVAIGYIGNTINFEDKFRGLPFSSDPGLPWYQGPAGFALLGALAICISCPRQIVSFFAGYFFGLWAGTGIALVATILGCILTFAIARTFRATFGKFIRGRLDVAVQFWKENAFFATLIWRFMPAGSNLLTNLAAGALGIPAIGFFLGSAIGYIPQTIVFAVVGSGVKLESGIQIAVSVGLFVVSALMGLALYARYRHRLKGDGKV